MRRFTPFLLIIVVIALGMLGAAFHFGKKTEEKRREQAGENAIERAEISERPAKYHVFTDDQPGSRNPQFDPSLVDSRAIGSGATAIEINSSGAVLTLDVPATTDEEKHLVELRPSFSAAAKALKAEGYALLPSINAVAAKVKQIDDGLYGAIELALVMGTGGQSEGEIPALVRDIAAKVKRGSHGFFFLYASLEVGGFSTEALGNRPKEVDKYVSDFMQDTTQSKPISFYTWSRELERTFQFLRFLQQKFQDRAIGEDIARVLMQDEKVLQRYNRMLEVYSKLTNPLNALTPADLADKDNIDMSLGELWVKKNIGGRHGRTGIYFLPYSMAPETLIIERALGETYLTAKPDPVLDTKRFNKDGTPTNPEPDMMALLVEAIREGKANLAPKENSGWYDYQVYSLESLLLPSKGPEHEKLLLSARYKQRLMEAFEANITRHRDTHSRQKMDVPKSEEVRAIYPRLRVEPAPTYFLRQARAYGFLLKNLPPVLPDGVLTAVKGVKEGGRRELSVADEIAATQRLLYGLYLFACEDIGLAPQNVDTEELLCELSVLVQRDSCVKAATEWLAKWTDDPDLAVDARISVPIYVNQREQRTVLWNNIGVRGAKLKAGYDQLPRWRRKGDSEWRTFDRGDQSDYVILVDEFASVPRSTLTVLNREEVRKVCDREKTREAIIEALKR
ncbi:MAG TPA: hypothetical protein VEJ63_01800 [Planctomycetota bacterium]|nr:hypothetical protein [Planctomycetota bacterium]